MITKDRITENFTLLQRSDKFKFGTDAALLSEFAAIKRIHVVADLCSGTGAAAFLTYLKYGQRHTFLVDIDPDMTELSRKTAELNGVADKFTFMTADAADCGIADGSIDYIVANPPYFGKNTGKISSRPDLAAARHRLDFSLGELFSKSYKMLRDGGKIALVYRAEYLAEVIHLLKNSRLEPKRLEFAHKSLFLLESSKNGGVGLSVKARHP